jgi:putative membrane protein
MVRALIRIVLQLVGNAIGLIVAAWILADMALDGAAFVIAVIIFTVLAVIVQPLIQKVALKNMEALQGSSALITTFIALLLTDWISDGLSITGAATWILATIIVWLITMLAGVILPMIFLKKEVVERR